MIVDQAIYRGGRRHEAPGDLGDLLASCQDGGGVAWVGLYRPTHADIAELAAQFDLHELAVDDAVRAHQRPKLDRYGDIRFIVLRTAHHDAQHDRIEFGEVHIFAGPRFVITVRHGQTPDLAAVRRRLEARPDLLDRGTDAIVHAIVDQVVGDFEPVVAAIEADVDEIEDDVFDGSPHASRRIYELAREVIRFQRATKPLVGVVAALMDDELPVEERRYLRDVHDHALRAEERADGFRELLQNILSVNLTLETKALSQAANRTNEEVKRISSWAAIFFAPTLVGTIYGMNFTHMPELTWQLGYPMAIALMLIASAALYAIFRRTRWL